MKLGVYLNWYPLGKLKLAIYVANFHHTTTTFCYKTNKNVITDND